MLRSIAWLSLFAVVTSTTNAQEDGDNGRYVAVTGTSVARVMPDTVVWSVSITDTDPILADARAANDERVRQVLALRGRMKIEPSDLQTSYLNVDKVYERDRDGNQREFRHYKVTRSVKIRQRDMKLFDEMLQALSEIENVSLSYGLESSDYHKIRFDTRLEALKAAKAKASAMTDLLGASLGRVLRIDESARSSPSAWANPMSNSAFYSGPEATPDDVKGSFAPGAIEVRVSVDVRFEIE